jgi:hypothetical protein
MKWNLMLQQHRVIKTLGTVMFVERMRYNVFTISSLQPLRYSARLSILLANCHHIFSTKPV